MNLVRQDDCGAQTRASAEQLKSQADKLSSLVQAFRIETPPT